MTGFIIGVLVVMIPVAFVTGIMVGLNHMNKKAIKNHGIDLLREKDE